MNPLALSIFAFWLVWSIWFNRPLPLHNSPPEVFTEAVAEAAEHETSSQTTLITHVTSHEFMAGFPFAYQTAIYDSDLKLVASDFRPLNLTRNLLIIVVTLACIPYAFSGVRLQLSSMFAITAIIAIALASLRLIDNSEFGYYVSYYVFHVLTIVFLSPVFFALVKYARTQVASSG